MVSQISRPWRSRCAAVLAVLSISAGAGSVSGQTDEQRAAARHVAIEGIKAFQRGDWAEAIERLQRAEQVVHAPTHLLYLARANDKLGKLVRARETYLEIGREKLADDAPPAFLKAQAEAATELEAIEKRIAYVTIGVANAPPGTRVLVDRTEVPSALVGVRRPIDPGKRTIEAVAPDGSRAKEDIELAEGEARAIELELVAADAPSARGESASPDPPPAEEDAEGGSFPVLPVVAFGVGAIGIAGGTVFALQSSSKRSDADALFDACGGPACPDTDPRTREIAKLDDDARSAQTLSIVSFVIGGLGIAGGVTLLLLDGSNDESASGTTVRPWIGLGSVGATGRF